MTDLFLGIDGGASKTSGVLLDGDGAVLSAGKGGGSAMVGKPSAAVCLVLRTLVDSLCEQAGIGRESIARGGLGLNGIDFADEHAVQLDEVVRCTGLPAERLTLVNDGIAALWGATPRPSAVLLQHGSAFTSAYRARHGGETLFDHLDVGRGFDLRWQALAVVARMIDGRLPVTPLKDTMLRHLGIADERQYAEAVFRHWIPVHLMAMIAPSVFRAWEEGDQAATNLVRRAIDDYALAAAAMVTRTGDPAPDVVFGGGVIRHAPTRLWRELETAVHRHRPSCVVKPPDLPPEYGAAIMAAFAGGRGPEALLPDGRRGREEGS